MTIRERIDQDLKKAMLEKNATARDALRVLKGELMLVEVQLGRPVEDGEVLGVIQKSVKQRKDAIAQFREGGRQDLVEAEEQQLAILEAFLPKALGEAETREAVEAIVKELGLTTKKDMGALMKALKARFPSADPKLANTIAATLLS